MGYWNESEVKIFFNNENGRLLFYLLLWTVMSCLSNASDDFVSLLQCQQQLQKWDQVFMNVYLTVALKKQTIVPSEFFGR